jgi:hypothetical protein
MYGSAEATLVERISTEAKRLVSEFSAQVPEDEIRELVAETAGSYQGSTVGTFVPLLVYRDVRDRLKGVGIHG